MLLVLPAIASPLAGCLTSTATRTTAADRAISADVCSVWRALPQASYDAGRDTAETVAAVRFVNQAIAIGNGSRAAYCAGMEQ